MGLADAVRFYASAFSDLAVALTGTVTGTNTGDLVGRPASGKPAAFAYMDMYRLTDGMIVEAWRVEHVAALLAQVGGTT